MEVYSNKYGGRFYLVFTHFVVVLFWGRSVYSGAVWYHDHLNQGVPLVVITEDQQVHDLL